MPKTRGDGFMKRTLSVVTACVLVLSLVSPAIAVSNDFHGADIGYQDNQEALETNLESSPDASLEDTHALEGSKSSSGASTKDEVLPWRAQAVTPFLFWEEDATPIDTVAALEAGVLSATGDEAFVLTDAFVADFAYRHVTIQLPPLSSSQEITIYGGYRTLAGIGQKHFSIVGLNTGTYAFKNLVFDGGGGIGGISVSAGELKLENCLLEHNSNPSGVVTLGSGSSLSMSNTTFANNGSSYKKKCF